MIEIMENLDSPTINISGESFEEEKKLPVYKLSTDDRELSSHNVECNACNDNYNDESQSIAKNSMESMEDSIIIRDLFRIQEELKAVRTLLAECFGHDDKENFEIYGIPDISKILQDTESSNKKEIKRENIAPESSSNDTPQSKEKIKNMVNPEEIVRSFVGDFILDSQFSLKHISHPKVRGHLRQLDALFGSKISTVNCNKNEKLMTRLKNKVKNRNDMNDTNNIKILINHPTNTTNNVNNNDGDLNKSRDKSNTNSARKSTVEKNIEVTDVSDKEVGSAKNVDIPKSKTASGRTGRSKIKSVKIGENGKGAITEAPSCPSIKTCHGDVCVPQNSSINYETCQKLEEQIRTSDEHKNDIVSKDDCSQSSKQRTVEMIDNEIETSYMNSDKSVPGKEHIDEDILVNINAADIETSKSSIVQNNDFNIELKEAAAFEVDLFTEKNSVDENSSAVAKEDNELNASLSEGKLDQMDLPAGVTMEENNFLCKPCNAKFTDYKRIVDHSTAISHEKHVEIFSKGIVRTKKSLYLCTLCSCNFKNLADAEAHLETCEHQKNGKPTAENMNLNESSINQVADKPIEEINLPDGFKKKGKIISCQVCNVSVGASQNIIQHSNTRQHRIYHDALQHGIIRLTKTTSRCKLCNCTIRKLSGVEEHLNSDQHKKNSKVTEEDENSSTSSMNEDISNSRDCLDLPDGIIKIENDFLCEPCDVQFLVYSAAVTHSKSKNHQKQLNLRHKSIIDVEKILHKSIPDDCTLLDSFEAEQQSGSNEQERNSILTSENTNSQLISIDKIDDEPHHISADIIQQEEGLFGSVCRIEYGERLDTMEHSNSKQHQIYESASKSDIIRVTEGETTCELCNCTLNGLDELENHMMSVEHKRNVKSDGKCEKSNSEVNIIQQAENTVVESEEKFVDKIDVTVRADNEIKSEIKLIDTTDSIEQAVEQCPTDLLIEEPENHTEHSSIEQREINDNASQDIIVQDSETPNKCRLCGCFMIGVHGVQEHLKSIQHLQMLELVADADNFKPISQNPIEEKPLQRKCRLQKMKEVEKKKGSSIFELQIDNSEPTSHEKQLDILSENVEKRPVISKCSGNSEPPAETEIPKLETNEKIDQEHIEELILPPGFVKKRGTLFCTLCKVGVGAYHNLVEHSQTRKHKIHYEASIKGLVQINKKESYCQHCNCSVVGTDGIEKHLESSEHTKNSGLGTLPIDSNKSITNENGEKLVNDATNLFDESPKETRDTCNNRSSNFPTESTEEPLQIVEDKGNSTLCHESRSSSSTSINEIGDLISFELTSPHEITKEETESSQPIDHTEVDKYSNVVEHTSTMQCRIHDDTLNGEDIIQVAEEKHKGQFYDCTAVAECPNETPSTTLASFLSCQPENMKDIWNLDLGIKSDLDNNRYPELSIVTSSSSLSFGIAQHDNKSNPSDLDDKFTFIEDDTKRVETSIHISTIFPSPESERGLYESSPDKNGEEPPLTGHSESAGSLLSAATSSPVPSFPINDMLEESTPCLSNNQYLILPVKEHANAPKIMFHGIENKDFLGERFLRTDNIEREEIKFIRCSICNWVVLDTYANIQRHLTSEKHQINQQSTMTPALVTFDDMTSSRFFKIESHIDWNTHLIKVLEVPRDQLNMMEKCFNWCDFCETRFYDEPSAHLRSKFHQELLHGIKPSGSSFNSTCSICLDVIFFPIRSTVNHINEPFHQKNLLGRTTNITKSSIKLYFSKPLLLDGIETIVEDFLFICTICNCRIIGTMDAEKHLNDPSHKARGKAFILKIRKNLYTCLVCYRLFFNLVTVEEHLNDKHHQLLRRRMSNLDPVNIVEELLEPVRLYQLNEYTCSICNSRIEGDLMFVLEHTLHQRHQTLLTCANFWKVKQITLSEVITETLDSSPLTETISIENALTRKPIDQYEIDVENLAIPDTVNIQGNEAEQRIVPWENKNRACNICNIIIPGGDWNLMAHRRTKQHLNNEEKLNTLLNSPICQLAPVETKKSQLERRISQDDIINIPDNNNNPANEFDVMSVQQTLPEPVGTNEQTIKEAACTTNKKPTACSTAKSTPYQTKNTTKIRNKKTLCCNFCNEETTNEFELHAHITRHLLPRFLLDLDENSEQPKNTDNDNKDSNTSMKFLEAQSAITEVLGDAESTEKVIESPKKVQSSKWRRRSLDISLEGDINIYEINEQKKKIIQMGIVLIVALGEERVYCLVCQRTVNNTHQIIYDHLCSINHLTFLQQMIEDHWQFKNHPDELSDMDLAYQYMEEIDDLSVQCHVCQKQLKNDTTVLNDHIYNGRHKKAWVTLAANAKTLYSALSPRMSGDFYTVNYYWCVPCELKFSMEIDFRKHLHSKKHLIEVDKFSTIGEPLIFDYCAVCSTLWCGFSKTFGYHSMSAMHKNYISQSSTLVTELPPSAERLLLSPNTNIDILMERVDNLLPESIQKETLVIQDLEKICNEKYPFVVAHPFGSRVTRLGTSHSDFDIFLDCSTKKNGTYDGSDSSIAQVRKRLLAIKSCLETNPHIWRINFKILNARTPIIKVQHLPTLIDCDLSFTSGLPVESTKLVKNYCEKLPICRKMIIFIRNWMNHCRLIGSTGIHRCAVSWMVIFFLQVKGLLPTVHDLIFMENQSRLIGGWEIGVSNDFDIIHTIDDIVELLENFFTFYATYDYRNNVICPLLGKNIEKTAFQNIINLPSEMETYVHHLKCNNIRNTFRIDSILCIQDPFDLSHNITKAVKKYVVYRLKSFCSLSAKILENHTD